MKGQLRIDAVFAFIVLDDDGTEGIVGMTMPDGRWMPLVGADLARVESLKPYARDIARTLRKDVRLIYFKDRHEIDVLKGKP